MKLFFEKLRKSNVNIIYKIGQKNEFSALKIRSGLLDFGDDLVVKEIENEQWETGSIHIWVKLLKIFKFDNVYDIGAYNGIYGIIACEMLKSDSKIRFIEANPFVYSRLIANLKLNGLSSAKAKWGALSDSEESSIQMHLRLDPSALTTAGSTIRRDNTFSVAAPNINITNFVSNLKGTLLAKIDIEGAEIPLVRQLLEKYRDATSIIMLEILTESNFREILKIAALNDFIIYPINEKSRALGNLFSFSTFGINRNYLVASTKAKSIINALNRV